MDLSVSENREQRCSFCGRKKSEVKRMIASPNEAAICDVCIEICNAIEALGGETARDRQFEGDAYYEMMKSPDAGLN